jgi:Holliday junction resolvase RusA-like endonuclease
MIVEFFVPGDPIPQGSKRNFGKGRMIDANPRLKQWRATIGLHASLNAKETITGPCHVELTFRMHRGASVTRKYPSVKPDVDKLARSVLDGLHINSKVFADDSLVIGLTALKFYADKGKQGVDIRIITI